MVVSNSRSNLSRTEQRNSRKSQRSSRKSSDRNLNSFELPPLEVKIEKISSVKRLLQSDEVNIVQQVKL